MTSRSTAPWSKTRRWSLRIGAYLMAVGGLIGIAKAPNEWASTSPDRAYDWWFWLVVSAVSALFSLVPVAVEHAFERSNTRNVSEERENRLVKEALEKLTQERQLHLSSLETIIAPMVHNLPKIAVSDEPVIESRALLNKLLGACRAHLSSDGSDTSANFYRFQGIRRGRYLHRADQTGLYARVAFRRATSDPEGTAVVERVMAGTIAFCRNVSDPEEQRKWVLDSQAVRNYKAFISVPVALDGEPLGMLSVNCSNLNVLRDHHVGFLRAVASMLAVLDPYLAEASDLEEVGV